MATTTNGHPVLFSNSTSGSLPRLRKWIIPGTNRHLYLRDGSMGFVLIFLALWYHQRVERLNLHNQVWDEWGWAVRPVRGQSSGYSNHAGGVAIDLNATQHPMGVSIYNTYTPLQIRRIRWRMRIFGGVVIWGGEWGRPDGMHFEIGKVPMGRVERLARRLMKTRRGRRILKANPGARSVILS